MSFFNEPENNPIKAILFVLVFAAAGYFVYHSMHANGGKSTAQVIDQTSQTPEAPVADQPFTFTTTTNGPACTMTVCSATDASQCIPLSGLVAKDGTCTPAAKQATPAAQGLYEIIYPAK